MYDDDYGSRSAAHIIISTVVIIVTVTAFALWWHRDTIFPSTDDTDEMVITNKIDEGQLEDTVKQLFLYNHMEVSDSELQGISTNNDAITLANELTPIVNSDSSTAKVIVPVISQNLLFVPAPSIVTAIMNGQVVPTLFIRADEATVIAYNPMTNIVVEYPFSSFSKSYDEAGRQCVFITDRGYSGY